MGAMVIAFLLAFPVGTLVEYLIHRFVLHARNRTLLAHKHRLHHKDNLADTLWADFRDFLPGMLPVGWIGFLHSTSAGIGFTLGGIVYVLFLATVHKLSHERPGLIFWMHPNSHCLHHCDKPSMNYGIVTRLWDRVFGTYADAEPSITTTKRAAL